MQVVRGRRPPSRSPSRQGRHHPAGAVNGEARWGTAGGIFAAGVVTLPLAATLAAIVALALGSRSGSPGRTGRGLAHGRPA